MCQRQLGGPSSTGLHSYWGAGPLQLSGSPHDGRSGMGNFFRPWWQQLGNPGKCMFQVIYVTMFIQQLFINIVGVKCITVLCSDRKYSGVAATTHCHPTVPYRVNGETNSHTPVCMPYVVAEYWSNMPFTFSSGGPRWSGNCVCLPREHFGGTHKYSIA